MPKNYPQFLLLGDSIIQFSCDSKDGVSFGGDLLGHCQRRLDVINRGLSGYNTAHELVILEDLIPSPSCAKVDYLLLLFGANDASVPDSPSKQHVPIGNFRENLRTILTHPSITAHKPIILLVTPPPIHEVHLLSEDMKKGASSLTRTQKATAQYAAVVRDVAKELEDRNVILIDLWNGILKEAARLTPNFTPGDDEASLGTLEKGDSEALRHLLLDGLHLTGAGYKVFLDLVLPHVGKEWAQEPLDQPTWLFPHWTIAPRIDR